MWILDNPDLPTTAAVADPETLGIPIALLDDGAGVFPYAAIESDVVLVATIPTITTTTLSLVVDDFLDITAVAVGDQVFTLAIDSESPAAGEFTWVAPNLVLHLESVTQLTPGLKLAITGVSDGSFAQFTPGGITLPSVSPLPTDWVPPYLFSVFYGLPVSGTINWALNFEQEPSGSVNLIVLRSGISSVRSRFAKGREIEFAGVGFSVSSFSEKLLNTHEYPNGVYDVSISLTGKWNRPKYTKPVFIRGGDRLSAVPSNAFQDPDCTLATVGSSTTTGDNLTTYPNTLAAQNQVGVQLAGNDWKISIAKDTAGDATTTWRSEIDSRLRQNGAFIQLSSPNAVIAKNINSVSSWYCWLSEIEISSQGDFNHSDGRFGYAAEYPNVKLDGSFTSAVTDTSEDTQGKTSVNQEPRWQKRTPVQQIVVNGDAFPNLPPADTGDFISLDPNFDISGPTKNEEVTWLEDGMTLYRRVRVYGFVFYGRDIFDIETKTYRAPGSPFWQLVREEVEVFNYDPTTGYLLGSQTTGWQLVRFAQETATLPETVVAELSDDEDEQRKVVMYEFIKAPIRGATAFFLEQFIDYYTDIESPPYVVYKKCNPDGSSSYAYKKDPTYVPPMFASVEETYRNTFVSIPHPKNLSADAQNPDFIPLADLTSGEETMNRRRVQILPSQTTGNNVGGFLSDLIAAQSSGDRYLEYTSSYSATGPGFKTVAEDTKATTRDGRPSIATKKPSLYEKVEPQSDTPEPEPATDIPYEYRLLTPGYTITNPVNGSVSYPNAKTLAAATLAAKTDLKIKDAQDSVNASVNIPFNHRIREFDVITSATKFDRYNFRAMNISNSVIIQGLQGETPVISSPNGTRITCGIDRTVPVTVEKVRLPQPVTGGDTDGEDLIITNIITKDVVLGGLIPGLVTRRNA